MCRPPRSRSRRRRSSPRDEPVSDLSVSQIGTLVGMDMGMGNGVGMENSTIRDVSTARSNRQAYWTEQGKATGWTSAYEVLQMD